MTKKELLDFLSSCSLPDDAKIVLDVEGRTFEYHLTGIKSIRATGKEEFEACQLEPCIYIVVD